MNGGLLTLLGKGESPRASPDGRRIVFVRPQQETRNKQLWVMNIDGSGQTQLTNHAADDIDPSWHPNNNPSHDDGPMFERKGRDIIFRSNRGGAWNLFSFQPKLK